MLFLQKTKVAFFMVIDERIFKTKVLLNDEIAKRKICSSILSPITRGHVFYF